MSVSARLRAWWVYVAVVVAWGLLCFWWALRGLEHSGAYTVFRLPAHFLYRFELPVAVSYLILAGPLGRRQGDHGSALDGLSWVGVVQGASLAACVHYTDAIEYATGWYRDQWWGIPLGLGFVAMAVVMRVSWPRRRDTRDSSGEAENLAS